MKKLYIVKNPREFEYIIQNGPCEKSKNFIIYHNKNNYPYDRFGISVGKKLGNAVFRNKYKRKIRSILDNYKKHYNNSEDYIIILRKNAINLDYIDLNNDLLNLFARIRKD